MKHSYLSLVVVLALGAISRPAAASPYVCETIGEFDVQAIFSPTNGYAHAYGNCYDLLQQMRELRRALWDTEAGKRLLDEPSFAHFWYIYDQYIETPCHLCERDDSYASYRESCAAMTIDLDSGWPAVEASAQWAEAQETAQLQAVFSGWQAFSSCMDGR